MELSLFGTMAEETTPFLKKGALVGIKGKFVSKKREENGKTWNELSVYVFEINVILKSGAESKSDFGPELNAVVCTGRLVRDCEFRDDGETALAGFTVAVDDKYKKDGMVVSNPVYIKLSLFGGRARTLNKYLFKGREIGFYGKLTRDIWSDKDGEKHDELAVSLVGNVELMSLPKNRSAEDDFKGVENEV